jgi:F-type H+-transporting ATPase subunit epsilon|tara:strand:+ start:1784 stop:2071 length:288 start_codon:yes stop_codon:yes gene_type:complete
VTNVFSLDIVTPTNSFSFDNVTYVKCPGTEGYFGIMKNHTNSILNLREGIISVKTDQKEIQFSCSSGIADINSDSTDDIPDKVLLLVENAVELEK